MAGFGSSASAFRSAQFHAFLFLLQALNAIRLHQQHQAEVEFRLAEAGVQPQGLLIGNLRLGEVVLGFILEAAVIIQAPLEAGLQEAITDVVLHQRLLWLGQAGFQQLAVALHGVLVIPGLA